MTNTSDALALPRPRGSVIPISALDELPGVELRHLQALAAIAQEGSITGAAGRLGYSQSAVSQQLAVLERLVGHRLVERTIGARTTTLTPAGRRLADHADAINRRLAAARADLDLETSTLNDTVRIGILPSVAAALLPSMIRRLRTTAPAIQIRTEESYEPAELLDGLHAGRHDLVLATAADEHPEIETVPLGSDPYVLLAPTNDRLATLGRAIGPRDLVGVDLIAKDCTAPSQRAIDAALTALGIPFTIRMRTDDARTVRELVAARIGVAIVPGLVAEPSADVAVLPLDGIVEDRVIAIHQLRTASRRGAVAAVAAAAHRSAPLALQTQRADR